jgi:hypothetical protein
MKNLKFITILLLFTLIISYSISEIYCLDIWLHLRAGEYILKNKAIPRYDIFSYTVSNKPWINHEWLSQIIFYQIYSKFGPNGLITLRVFIISGVFLLLFFLGYKKENYIIVTLLLLAVLFSSEARFMLRPGLFTLFFTAIFLFILNKYRDTKFLYVLPFIQLLWINMHGYCLIGVFAIVAYIIDEIIKKRFVSFRLLSVGLLIIAAPFINPNGWKGFMYPFATLFSFTGESRIFFRQILELQPLVSGCRIHLPHLIIPWFKIIIFISALSFLINFRKLNIGNFALYIIFLAIALKTNRNVALFSIIAYSGMILNFNDIHDTSRNFTGFKKIENIVKGMLAIALIAFMSFAVFRNFTNEYYSFKEKRFKKFYFGLGSIGCPEEAVDFIAENKIKGNILHDFNCGAYLIWRLFPWKRVFIDGRTELYGPEFFEKYQKTFSSIEEIRKAVSRYNINCILVSYVFDIPVPVKVLKFLNKDKEWALVYVDNLAAIFVKNTKENKTIIEKFEVIKRKSNHAFTEQEIRELKKRNVYPYPMIKTAYVLESLGLYEQALEETQYALRIKPDSVKAYQLAGFCYIDMEDYNTALEKSKTALRLEPSNITSHYLAGRAYIGLEQYEKAVSEFDEVWEGCKKQRGAYKIFLSNLFTQKGIAYKKMGNAEKSREALLEALRINPENEKAKKYLQR